MRANPSPIAVKRKPPYPHTSPARGEGNAAFCSKNHNDMRALRQRSVLRPGALRARTRPITRRYLCFIPGYQPLFARNALARGS